MTCARTSRSNKTRAHPPSSRRERAHFDALRTFAMGRGRRGARSSDDEDDGVSPAPRGVQSSQVSGGGRAGKKWQPGMSGSQQKARAKEQRLEQERRKAERERRNEDNARGARSTAPDRGAPRHPSQVRRQASPQSRRRGFLVPRRGHPRPRPEPARHPPPGRRPRAPRALRRLFGRIEHGGGSLLSGRVVLVDDVVVVLHESSVEERRKSGAGAWSQRLQKGGERDVSLSAFLAMNGARDVAGSPSVYSSSPTSGLGAGFAGSAASAPEPPYHLVARVVARWPSVDDDLDRRDDRDAVEEETLWTNHQGGPSVMAIVDDFGEMRLGGSPGGFGSRSPGDAFPGGVSDGRLRDRDAFSLLPRHCWEDVASLCDPRSLARLAATCAGLAGVVRSTTVRRAAHARVFGKPPPPRLIFAKVASARRGSSRAPRRRRRSRRRRRRNSARDEDGRRRARRRSRRTRGYLARLTRTRRRRTGARTREATADAEDDAAFDADDADFARERDARPARTLTPVDDEEEEGDRDVTWFARDAAPRAPSPKYSGVGPHSAIRMLADAATAVSCDGAKIKLWFHGGDGQTEAGKRIATLPNPAGSRPWTSPPRAPASSLLATTPVGSPRGTPTRSRRECPGSPGWWAHDRDRTETRRTRSPRPSPRWRWYPRPGSPRRAARAPLSFDSSTSTPNSAGATRGDVHLNGGRVDDRGHADHGDSYDVRDVDDLVVTGVAEGYRDSTGTRVFAPRGSRAGTGAPKLWAATGRGDGGAALVAIDLETATVTERIDAGKRFFETRDDTSTSGGPRARRARKSVGARARRRRDDVGHEDVLRRARRSRGALRGRNGRFASVGRFPSRGALRGGGRLVAFGCRTRGVPGFGFWTRGARPVLREASSGGASERRFESHPSRCTARDRTAARSRDGVFRAGRGRDPRRGAGGRGTEGGEPAVLRVHLRASRRGRRERRRGRRVRQAEGREEEEGSLQKGEEEISETPGREIQSAHRGRVTSKVPGKVPGKVPATPTRRKIRRRRYDTIHLRSRRRLRKRTPKHCTLRTTRSPAVREFLLQIRDELREFIVADVAEILHGANVVAAYTSDTSSSSGEPIAAAAAASCPPAPPRAKPLRHVHRRRVRSRSLRRTNARRTAARLPAPFRPLDAVANILSASDSSLRTNSIISIATSRSTACLAATRRAAAASTKPTGPRPSVAPRPAGLRLRNLGASSTKSCDFRAPDAATKLLGAPSSDSS